MESYIEVVFIHNCLIHSISLTIANIFSRKVMSNLRFIQIVLCITLLPSILFLENNSWILMNEMICFLLFHNQIHTYFIFIGNRMLFQLIYFLLFEGTIQHLIFFPFTYSLLFICDFILFILYISLLIKAKYIVSEKDFICNFYILNKKYKGYIDSGNFATYQNIPIIFVKENIYEQIQCNPIFIHIQTIQDENQLEVKKTQIKMNHKTIEVLCGKGNISTYDAILNMKGIL